ncbi:cadherin-like and PC-esterase domain-containing protein 1 isoform X2 [Gouania willdenowi]|uniref:cadherin-like and PC-esterase domain-containing protein 1 isoform X2 n=1 Tax=Gouania willdenowi TaxID=441366 RepID=UPI001056DE13|nr:cadherin-like and PC-esterase domain-containing protein 1 isoform X2 [Gouania willdenowi]XP_028307412.1 cadherin-like and PC-esterase domain-containing protein 1 isoform X2 [Gouania willdenowi]XP_028307413.1 cadherin-like and PC-esterase domain-containing protein 1 isoform X2 [Gouania willdenowi]XP_028307414.1 cadherin-like and PC-esterase domain-containing protein 1 isoform X2 [Gouania willdenowi]XP_028307415.1 cadherin-like and PC-esterase domain-containing protein 1 isoform X2 [Gouania wi
MYRLQKGLHKVNLLPALKDAFSDAGEGVCAFMVELKGSDLPIRRHSCGSTNKVLPIPLPSDGSKPPPFALVAMVNVYLLVTSLNPLTAFLHDISVVRTNQQPRGWPVKLRDFLKQHFGTGTSHQTFGRVKEVIAEVLQVAGALSSERQQSVDRCGLCFQLLSFTLLLSHSFTITVVQVDTELTLSSLSAETFDRQITKDLILEDTLHFLLPEPHSDKQQQLRIPFTPVTPWSWSGSWLWIPQGLSNFLFTHHLKSDRNNQEIKEDVNQEPVQSSTWSGAVCADPHLRQIYTDPLLTLTPMFSPEVKQYRVEVSFDTVMIRIRPVTVSPACKAHLDEQHGPRIANYPVGLGNNRITVLVTDDRDPKVPAIMSIYTIHMFRESRPSLPMFGDHVTCSFLQDCGLQIQPNLPCGLQPHIQTEIPHQTCSSGHAPGRWVVPCLSCSDNRTCDWRQVAWKPDGCFHQLVPPPLLQDCLRDRKVLFIGDSTNRGMMYFLMERLNSSLEDWSKVHHTLVHRNLNGGRSLVSYSYHPQFWLEKERRPTFRQALLKLLHRSFPLENSNQTVVVVGGVQWLNPEHLRTVKEVLDSAFLRNIVVVVKTLGMGFHLPVDGIHSLNLVEIQNLFQKNKDIITAAEHYGYEVIDTFSITMGRYKEFLQGRCACHFHEVQNLWTSRPPINQTAALNTAQGEGYRFPTYHVSGAVNQVYAEILLSRLCLKTRT